MMLNPSQGARALSVLALAQLLAPVQPTTAVGSPAFAMPLRQAPLPVRRLSSACRCAGESGIAQREQAMPEETETCVFEAVEQSSWVMVIS